MRRLFDLLLACFVATPALAQPKLPEGVERKADIVYGKAGNVELKLDLYLPREKAKKPRPVVVWIHGGGWEGGNKNSGAGLLGPLVATGEYAGVSIAYRLTNVTPWPGQIHDCKAAIRWIRAHAREYAFDPERIGVWGISAGGHLSAMLGTSAGVAELEGENGSPKQSSRVRCVVDLCGPTDMELLARENPALIRQGAPVYKLLGGTIEEKPALARSASPVTHVGKDAKNLPAFLIMHGTSDKLVPLSQAERLHEALKKAGADSTLVKVTDGPHVFFNPEVLQRVRTFFDRHLLGKDVTVSSEAIPFKPAK